MGPLAAESHYDAGPVPLFHLSLVLVKTMTEQTVRISLLHAALKHGNFIHNLDLLESLFLKALAFEPNLIVTPELAVSGYEFFRLLGADWIKTVGPQAIARFCDLARDHQVAVILGSPWFDGTTNRHYNAAILIDEQGRVAGKHCKINVLPGSEGWSSPGPEIRPIVWNGHKLGLLICSDAYTPNHAAELARQGAEVLISPAAWAPGFHGPSGEWEQRSQETGLCVYVCNRTGAEVNMNFEGSLSVVIAGGHRLIDYSQKQAAILSLAVQTGDWRPLDKQFTIVEV